MNRSKPPPEIPLPAIESIVDAVGTGRFAHCILKFLQELMPMGQIACLIYQGPKGFAPLFLVGDIATPRVSSNLEQQYCERYFRLDPNLSTIQNFNPYDSFRIARFDAGTLPSSQYRSVFWQRQGYGDKCSLIFYRDGHVFYCNFYRAVDTEHFSRAEYETIERLAPLLSSLISKHYRLTKTESPDGFGGVAQPSYVPMVPRHEATEAPSLSPRENMVLQLLLTGLNNEAIALDQNLSINTIKVYRRRLYKKLGVTSLNELYAKTLRDDFRDIVARRPQAASGSSRRRSSNSTQPASAKNRPRN